MTKITNEEILQAATRLYARTGFEDFSIRKLAKEINITHSVIYHYYKNEKLLLKAMFEYATRHLGRMRADLELPKTADEMLKQRIAFQIEHSEFIVSVLKYYFAHRLEFQKNKKGFIPDKSTLHIEEVLEYGMKTNEFRVKNIADDAKVIAHAINGFLLEYYPHQPTNSEKKALVERIHSFLIRALKGGDTSDSQKVSN